MTQIAHSYPPLHCLTIASVSIVIPSRITYDKYNIPTILISFNAYSRPSYDWLEKAHWSHVPLFSHLPFASLRLVESLLLRTLLCATGNYLWAAALALL